MNLVIYGTELGVQDNFNVLSFLFFFFNHHQDKKPKRQLDINALPSFCASHNFLFPLICLPEREREYAPSIHCAGVHISQPELDWGWSQDCSCALPGGKQLLEPPSLPPRVYTIKKLKLELKQKPDPGTLKEDTGILAARLDAQSSTCHFSSWSPPSHIAHPPLDEALDVGSQCTKTIPAL